MQADIVAPITAPITSAVISIRISGTTFLKHLPKLLTSIPGHQQASVGFVLDKDGQALDQVVSTYFEAPNSFTGEHVLEISMHGNPILADRILKRCYELDIQPARPGEFSLRAFQNQKLSLDQAQSIHDVVSAQSEQALDMAQRTLQGHFTQQIQAISKPIIQARMQLEAHLDFSDEDIEPMAWQGILSTVTVAYNAVRNLRETIEQSRKLFDGFNVPLVGASNVGKSSLMNYLAGRQIALVDDASGTTRDRLEVNLQWKGVQVTLQDTAGIRPDAESSIELQGMELSKQAITSSQLVLLVQPADKYVALDQLKTKLDLPSDPSLQWLSVVSKSDLLSKTQQQAIINKEAHKTVVLTSAKEGWGKQELIDLIYDKSGLELTSSGLTASSHQARMLVQSEQDLLQARELLSSANAGVDEVAMLLAFSCDHLLEVIGPVTSDDVLDQVFSNFCIGK